MSNSDISIWIADIAYNIYVGAASQGSQALSPKSLEVNTCNLNRWEHGSWDIATMLGLANMSGTWDPMWTGPNKKLQGPIQISKKQV